MSRITCDFNQVNGDYRLNDMFFWSKDSCNLLLKIAKNGNIAIVHDIFDSSNIVSHVEECNENFFRVQWTTEDGSWPLASNICGSCAVVEVTSACVLHESSSDRYLILSLQTRQN